MRRRDEVTSSMGGGASSVPSVESGRRQVLGGSQRNVLDTIRRVRKGPIGLPVKVKIDNSEVTALIDTGATVSIVENKSLTNYLYIKGKPLALNTTAGMTVTRGVANVGFDISDMRFQHDCHAVNDLNIPGVSLILGIDFISSQDVTIYGGRVGRPRVFISNKEINLLNIQVPSTAATLVTPVEGYVRGEEKLPAASLQFIYVSPSNPLPEGTLVIIEPFERVSEYILSGVMEVKDGMIPVPCINLSSEALAIDGNSLCHLWPCDLVTAADSETSVCLATATADQRNSFLQMDRNKRVIEMAVAASPRNFEYVITDVMSRYLDIVAIGTEKPGQIQHHPFKIDTGSHPPIQSRQYRIPVSAQQDVAEEISRLKEQGIISESSSPWSSPVVLVKKKDGSSRLCVDYRKLNEITKDDKYPIPSIEELLVKVRGSKYFSTLDLKSGYHQIPVSPEDKPKTAFIANDALHEYNFLPFGVKNAPGHFSRVMMSVLAGLIGEAVLVYLDDLIILGRDAKEHTGNLIRVLEALRRHGLKLNLEKCKFFQEEVEFLGHRVSSEGIKPCIDKVEVIRNFPAPRNAKEVASFLGMAGYYRKFIRGFGEIARPLDALRHSNNFEWGEREESAFQRLKMALTSNELLAYPNFDKPFIVTTDASNIALGGVISQVDEAGIERPICYASKALKGAEKNYSTHEKEALGIIWMLERHRFILLGHEIIIKCDNRPLRDLFKKQNLNSRQSRWIERLLEFNIINFEHVAGKQNKVADALSRRVCGAVTRAMNARGVKGKSSRTDNEEDRDLSPSVSVSECEAQPQANERGSGREDTEGSVTNDCPMNEKVVECGWDEEELKKEQSKEDWIREIKECVEGKSSRFPQMINVPRTSFVIEGDILYQKMEKRKGEFKYRVVLPSTLHERALHLVHTCPFSGHLGVDRTIKKARDNFFWVGMKASVKEYIAKCHECACAKNHKTICPEGRRWPVPPKKFYRVHIDLVGPFPVGHRGHRYICVIVDALTRYTFVYAMKDKSATSVAGALHCFIMKYGCPKIMISDNGREFINEIVSSLMKLMKINHFPVQAYRPAANGLVESHNREIVQLLRLIIGDNPGGWAEALPTAEFALNTAYNKSIRDSPYYLVYGQDPVLPYSVVLGGERAPVYNVDDFRTYLTNLTKRVFDTTERVLKRASTQYKTDYDIRHKVGDPKIDRGDRVYLKRLQPRQHKLEPAFIGPYRVLDVKENKVRLRNIKTGKECEYHASHVMKKEYQVAPEENDKAENPFPSGEEWEEESLRIQ